MAEEKRIFANMKQWWLFYLGCMVVGALHAQGSAHSLIYRISAAECQRLLTDEQPDATFLQGRTPVDTLWRPLLADTFSLGHYVVVKVLAETVHTYTFSSNDHQVFLHEDPKQLNISVVDKTGSPVPAQHVKLEKRALSYRSDTHHYTTRRRKGGLLTVTLAGDTLFYTVDALEEKPIIWRRLGYFQRSQVGFVATAPVRWAKGGYRYLKRGIGRGQWRIYRRPLANFRQRRQQQHVFKGYMASQQPIYRHGDTLRLGAYVANQKGRPQAQPLALEIHANNKKWLDTLVTPAAPGQYAFDWVLGDTLPLDTRYTVLLHDKYHNHVALRKLHYHFKVEDYALKTYTFKLTTTQQTFQPHEPVRMALLAEDANGLPAAATTITGLVRMTAADAIYADSLYARDTLWTFREEISDQASVTIAPPDSIWPQASSKVEWVVTFQSPVGEYKTITHPLTVHRPPFAPIIVAEADSVRVSVAGNSTPARERGILTVYQGQRELEQVPLPAGAAWPMHPLATSYGWVVDGQRAHLSGKDLAANVTFDYQWRNDTLVLVWDNPRQLDIAWTLQHHQGGLHSGSGSTAQLLEILPYGQHRRQAWLYYSYTWNGQQDNKTQDLRALNNQLTLAVDAPDCVYPGQTTPVALTLTDSEGRPVPAAPLTALAYNAQFNASAPVEASQIEYRGRRQPFKRQRYGLMRAGWSGTTRLQPYWHNAFGLDTSAYYRLRFPADTGYVEYTPVKSADPMAQTTAQLAPWVMHGHRAQTVYMVYLDNRLVYFQGAWQHTPYSIVAEPGYHQVAIRTALYEIRMDSVFLRPGHRADLSVDVVQYDTRRIRVSDKPPYLERQAAEHISRRIFYWEKGRARSNAMYLHQDGRQIFRLSGQENDIVPWGLFDANRELTRLAPGQDTLAFKFEPGFYYQLEKNRERLYQHAPLLDVKKPYYFSTSHVPKLGEEAIFLLDIPTRQAPIVKKYPLFDNNKIMASGRMGRLQVLQNHAAKALIISHSDKLIYLLNPNTGVIHLPPGAYQLSTWLLNDSIRTQTITIRPYELLVQKLDTMQAQQPLPEPWRTAIDARPTTARQSQYQNPTTPNPYTGVGRLISGYVTDDTGEVLLFASVAMPRRINGTYIGTETDLEGYYELWVPFDLEDIEVSYVGYATTFVKIGGSNRVDVQMSSEGMQLNEVTISAYKIPLVERDNTTQSMALTSDVIRSMPTRNLNAIAAIPAGLSSSVELKGSRNEATGYYLDGTPNDPLADLPPPTDTLRDSFRDYAYWQPTLLTDRNGRVQFPVTFPDDITTWRHTAVGMDGRTRIGMGTASTRAYLPLQAQLYTPRFLVEGDRASVTGLITNQTGQPLTVTTTLQQDDDAPQSQTLEVARAAHTSYPLPPVPVGMDSTWLTFRLQSNAYQDGERRPIPVYRQGTKRTVGAFHVLNDTLPIPLQADPTKGPVHLRVAGNALPQILDAIRYLHNYRYHCNEQTASRLFALLAARRVSAYLAPTDSLDAEIHTVLQRLADRQLPTGGWSWWAAGQPSAWITRHVMRALTQAQAAGFTVPDVTASERWLLSTLPESKLDDRLDGLLFFAERQQPLNYAAQLEPVDTLRRDLATELTYRRIQQLAGLPYTLDSLDKYRQTTLMGAHYWGQPSRWWHYGYRHNFRLTLQAYELLKAAGRTSELPAVLQHFLTHRHPDHHKVGTEAIGMNTYENSLLVNTLLPDMMGDNGALDTLTVTLLSQQAAPQEVRQFPYQSQWTPVEVKGMQVQKSGDGPAFVSYYQRYWETEPRPEDNGFDVQTTLTQNGRTGNRLRLNEGAVLTTTVTLQADAEYVLIEVPVPAGCAYGTKAFRESSYETHREYQRDRMAVFCERLPAGKYTFTVRLEPRFVGSYTLNPARAEMMYAPTFNGMGPSAEVVIEE